MIHIYFPLSEARWRKAVAALQRGVGVALGGCRLYPGGSVIQCETLGRRALMVHENTDAGMERVRAWVNARHRELFLEEVAA